MLEHQDYVGKLLKCVTSIYMGPADFKTVGLTRRGPPTCRQRRDWSRHAEENFQRNPIPSHLTLRAKVGRPRRVSPTLFNRQPTSFLYHAVGDKSAGRGGPALPPILNSGGRDDHPP
jgi:hypothetical protein